MTVDEEVRRLIERKALEIASRSLERRVPMEVGGRVETDDDVVREVKLIVKGDRAREIVDGAYELYGRAAVEVFRRIIELYRQGRIRELWDYELYSLLERLGLRVPLRTRVRIVRHGREESIGERLSSQD